MLSSMDDYPLHQISDTIDRQRFLFDPEGFHPHISLANTRIPADIFPHGFGHFEVGAQSRRSSQMAFRSASW